MKLMSKKLLSVVVAIVFASSLAVLAGCSSPASSGSASSAAEASSASAGMPNPWSDVASAEEAAKGAGLDSFVVPEGEIADMGKPLAIHYRCMDGMAEAVYEFPAAEITARTAKIAEDESFDVSGDYGEYSKEWTENINNVSVACAGNREGESTKTYWGEGTLAHSITALGLGGDEDFGLTVERLTVFVEAMN